MPPLASATLPEVEVRTASLTSSIGTLGTLLYRKASVLLYMRGQHEITMERATALEPWPSLLSSLAALCLG